MYRKIKAYKAPLTIASFFSLSSTVFIDHLLCVNPTLSTGISELNRTDPISIFMALTCQREADVNELCNCKFGISA